LGLVVKMKVDILGRILIRIDLLLNYFSIYPELIIVESFLPKAVIKVPTIKASKRLVKFSELPWPLFSKKCKLLIAIILFCCNNQAQPLSPSRLISLGN